ncbi:MAG: hypothetical protein WBA20_17225 [Ketobacter sp.]|uniref:hypothetical protein n=1 Tax=Ketobacter sp. MCCC 1A13808 TaxID=2602738 RepID=UPI0018DC0707|nr:hypothetical protein [Ketobacter sp. MCCC 1A13808]
MYIDRLVLIFIAGAYVLSPTLMQWWAGSGTSWWRPFLVWGFLIGVTFWIARSRDLDGF